MNPAVVRIYESELESIVHETSLHPNIETGGSLFGLWTADGNPTIVLATRPGPRAVRQRAEFEQDLELHKQVEMLLLTRHGAQGLGLWHSHHGLELHELSSGDLNRTMKYSQRNKRLRFCDLLCYFGKTGRDRNAYVVIKPYVYADAPRGVHVPTELIVLAGTSPVRAALLAESEVDESETMRIALAAVPAEFTPNWRLAQSSDHLSGFAEDATVPGGFAQWFRFGRRDKLAFAAAEPDEDTAASAGGGETTAVPPSADSADDNSGAATPPSLAIPDLETYLHQYVEPALNAVPKGIRCEVTVTDDGNGLQLKLLSIAGEVVELCLGWDGRAPVALSLVAIVREQPQRQELLDHPTDLVTALNGSFDILTRARRR